jgi:outer membrane protein assembly factor BamB
MSRLGISLGFGLSILLFAGCANQGSLKKEFFDKPSAWPFSRGEVSSTGFQESGQFGGHLDLLWEVSTPDKPAGPLTIYHDALLYPGTKKRLRVYDLSTGKKLLQVKFVGAPQTGVVMDDSLAFFAVGPSKDRLYCFDLARRRQVWSQAVKDASGGSIIVNDRLIISSGNGTVTCFDPADGRKVWSVSVEGKCVAPASYRDGKLFQPTDRGFLYGLSELDGKELFRAVLKGPANAAVAVDGLIYATDVLGNVYGISPDSGHVVWETRLAGPVWTSPAVAGDRLVAGHSGGELVALERKTGKQIWSYSTVEVVKASPLIVGEYVIAGTMGGKLVVLKLGDGSLVSEKRAVGSIAEAPASDGRVVIVATENGKIRCYGERNDGSTQSDNRGASQDLAK